MDERNETSLDQGFENGGPTEEYGRGSGEPGGCCALRREAT
jgi:hypothetical protein